MLAKAGPENQERIQRTLASLAKEVTVEVSRDRDFTRSTNLVQELNRNGKLNEQALLKFATDRRYEEVASTLALFCQVPVNIIATLMRNVHNDGILTACKAAQLGWPTVNAILHSRFAYHSIPARELAQAERAFAELTSASAQRTLRFMAVQHSARQKAS
jgi:hypothetical protein